MLRGKQLGLASFGLLSFKGLLEALNRLLTNLFEPGGVVQKQVALQLDEIEQTRR